MKIVRKSDTFSFVEGLNETGQIRYGDCALSYLIDDVTFTSSAIPYTRTIDAAEVTETVDNGVATPFTGGGAELVAILQSWIAQSVNNFREGQTLGGGQISYQSDYAVKIKSTPYVLSNAEGAEALYNNNGRIISDNYPVLGGRVTEVPADQATPVNMDNATQVVYVKCADFAKTINLPTTPIIGQRVRIQADGACTALLTVTADAGSGKTISSFSTGQAQTQVLVSPFGTMDLIYVSTGRWSGVIVGN
jgi:hypothetical protein